MLLKPFFSKYTDAFSQRIPPVQNIAIGWFFFNFFRYFGKSLKLSTSGLIAPLNVPTSYSNGFLASIRTVSFSLISLFHLIGSTWLSFFFILLFKIKFIGTTSFLIFTLGLWNGWNELLETLLVLNSLNLRVLFKLLIMNLMSAALPEIVPFTPSLEIIIVPLMFFFFKVSNKTFWFFFR